MTPIEHNRRFHEQYAGIDCRAGLGLDTVFASSMTLAAPTPGFIVNGIIGVIIDSAECDDVREPRN